MFTRLLEGRLLLLREAVPPAEAAETFTALLRETPWLAVRYENAGRPVELPRLTVNYGERSYDYAGLRFEPRPWTPRLAGLKARAEAWAQAQFNALIVQLYRDGRDGVNWHADDNPAVGVDPTIVSLSFGTSRRFLVRPRGSQEVCLDLELHAGDAVIMRGDMQHAFQHRVPPEPAVTAPRINLTFRAVNGPPAQEVVPHSSREVRWPEGA